jgi:antimicrobial peptide system SdpB family protein
MSWLSTAMVLPARWESRSLPLALGRAILAAASLAEIVLTPDGALTGSAATFRADGYCAGVRAVSLWCVSDAATHSFLFSRIVAVVVLAAVLVGYRPALTCVPHWYVAFSLGSSMLTPSGGDAAAQVATLLLIPLCLGDPRRWQWMRPADPVAPRWRGSALAAHWAIRLQVLVIYGTSAFSKLVDPAWRQGAALYFVAYDPVHGFPPALRDTLAPVLGSYWAVAALSWSVIVVEALIAVLVVGTRRTRLVALMLGAGLHTAIALLMGLPSFALVMIAMLVTAYGGRFVATDPPPPTTAVADPIGAVPKELA